MRTMRGEPSVRVNVIYATYLLSAKNIGLSLVNVNVPDDATANKEKREGRLCKMRQPFFKAHRHL